VEGKKHLKMNLSREERIKILVELGRKLTRENENFEKAKVKAFAHNPWFTTENIDKAVQSIRKYFLDKMLLSKWIENYPVPESSLKNVGLIMAGNIPLVGFHDLLCVFVAGHRSRIKLSSKDEVLMKFVLDELIRIDARCELYFSIEERLSEIDAVIATGSNNTSRYFEYYFGKYPNIIRKNRNGVAVLTGDEEEDDLRTLSADFFDFFGLGCRNITKLYVPESYDFEPMLGIFDEMEAISHHHKYRNNFDYNFALYLLNKDKFLVSKTLILKEDPSYISRIACLHHESYTDLKLLKNKLESDEEMIQCIATKTGVQFGFESEIKLGDTQIPSLTDYADGVDTMDFLIRLT